MQIANTLARRLSVCFSIAALVGAVSSAQSPVTAVPRGLVVESPGGLATAGGRARLKPGDVLQSWVRREGPPPGRTVEKGEFRTPYDAVAFGVEQVPRGDTEITIARRGATLRIPLKRLNWSVGVRPILSDAQLERLQDARLMESIRDPAAADAWLALGEDVAGSDPEVRGWFIERAADILFVLSLSPPAEAQPARYQEAVATYELALDTVRHSGGSEVEAQILHRLGNRASGRRDPEAAARRHEAALTIRARIAPGSLSHAASLSVVASNRDQRAAAARPPTGSIPSAVDDAETLRLAREGLAINERAAPQSAEHGFAMRTVARIERRLGRPAEAAALEEHAIRISDAAVPREPKAGVVVERVQRHSAMDLAGIESGDVLVSWRRKSAADTVSGSGDFRTPFDWATFALEELPRGGTEVVVLRDEQSVTMPLRAGDPTALGSVHPALDPEPLSRYLRGDGEVATGKPVKESGWGTLALAWTASGDHARAAWILVRTGELLFAMKRPADADLAFDEAVAQARMTGDPRIEVRVRSAKGSVAQGVGDFARAESALTAALKLAELRSFELMAADVLTDLAFLQRARERYQDADALLRRALVVQRRLANGSVMHAIILRALGETAGDLGDLIAQERLQQEALAIVRAAEPGSWHEGILLNSLGLLASRRGDAARAETLWRNALKVFVDQSALRDDLVMVLGNLGIAASDRGDLAEAERLFGRLLLQARPDSGEAAHVMLNLGTAKAQRGDIAAAEALFERAARIQSKSAPDEALHATILRNLANVAETRGDLDSAEAYADRARAIRQKSAPASQDVADSLLQLAELRRARGNTDDATRLASEARTILDRQAPRSVQSASVRTLLGHLARDRQDWVSAEKLYQEALDITVLASPGHARISKLQDLGDLAMARKDFARAERWYREALSTSLRLVPTTELHAAAANGLGSALMARGVGVEGERYLREATAAVDAVVSKAGGSPFTRASFSSKHVKYYYDYLARLIDVGRSSEAFAVLERARSRALVDSLAERDLLFSAELPAELRRERAKVWAEYDDAQDKLASLDPATRKADVDAALLKMKTAGARLEALAIQVRALSPALASLQYPRPLTLAGARTAIDPGTVLLTYAVTAERTYLFVVTPASAAGPGVTVFPIAITEPALRESVEAFRELIARRGTDPRDAAALVSRGRALYDQLVRPAEALMLAASRIVIATDRSLSTLPFHALVTSDGPDGTRWLIESKAISFVPSVSTFSALKRARPQAPRPARVMVFADPEYPPLKRGTAAPDASTPEEPERQLLTRNGYNLRQLPGTRLEAEAIARLYGSSATVHLGAEASETRAKQRASDATILHFAAHGLVNNRFPLNSSIALAIPQAWRAGRDNGFLQAWEIYDGVRLKADLVTLSACASGLGTDFPGEGLMGLTRAFLFAGARSVVASLWEVADESTSALMAEFYRALKSGATKDDALRTAQIAALRGLRGARPEFQSPFYWAAFQVSGDWR